MHITQRGVIKESHYGEELFLSADITYTENVKWVTDITCFSNFVYIYI